MNVLLIFFALPVATVILAIVLQKILKCPLLVGATFFAIYLIVAFVIAPNGTLLVYAILFSILAYITAVLTCVICKLISRFGNILDDNNCSCNSCNSRNNNLATVRVIDSGTGNNCISNNSVTTVTTTTGSGPLNTTSNTYLTERSNNTCSCGRICRRR